MHQHNAALNEQTSLLDNSRSNSNISSNAVIAIGNPKDYSTATSAATRIHDANAMTNSTGKLGDNVLYQNRGKKWNDVFDFDKALKQLRIAEKQLRGGLSTSSSISSNKSQSSSTSCSTACSSSPKAASTTTTSSYVRQVQRLNGADMHYYGIAPKQSMHDIVVCNVCLGTYKKAGFNNHMMLQHPSVWSTISTKLQPPIEKITGFLADETADIIVSAQRKNSSAVSTSILMQPPPPVTSQTNSSHTHSRHKSSSKSGSSGGSRSKSKSKHHSSVSLSTSTVAVTESTSTSTHKSNKKHAVVAAVQVAKTESNIVAPILLTASGGTAENVLNRYSPAHMITTNAASTTALTKHSESTKQKMPLSTSRATVASIKSSKRKTSRSPSVLISTQDLADLTDGTTNLCNCDYERAHDLATITAKTTFTTAASTAFVSHSATNSSAHYATPTVKPTPPTNSTNTTPTVVIKTERRKHIGGKDLKQIEQQMRELDEAVSSISDMPHTQLDEEEDDDEEEEEDEEEEDDDEYEKANEKEKVAFNRLPAYKAKAEAKATAVESIKQQITTATVPMRQHHHQHQQQENIKEEDEVEHEEEDQQQVAETQLLHHETSTEDSSIITLEFINEILSTSDREITFDENQLDESVAQQSYVAQPINKRMRLNEVEEEEEQQQQQQQQEVNAADYALYQQQQPQQQQNQYATYDTMKLYAGDYAPQQQQQLTTIDAEQLQQLLYQQQQQQQQNTQYTELIDESVMQLPHAQQQQLQQQLHQLGYVNANADDLQKYNAHALDDNKLNEYVTLTTLNNNAYESSEMMMENLNGSFQIHNVPSLTDDNDDYHNHISHTVSVDDAMLMPPPTAAAATLTAPAATQYVLPASTEEQLIYEITANNEVAVMSQDRQKAVIAEFLTHAQAYENGIGGSYMQTTAVALNAAPTQQVTKTANDLIDDGWLQDFDCTLFECVPSTAHHHHAKDVKQQEEIYYNVFNYSSLPKPLHVNDMGLVKMPQCTASTFRKQLLTMRKANNSPISLIGSSSSSTSTTRFAKSGNNSSYFASPSSNNSTAGSSSPGSSCFSGGSTPISEYAMPVIMNSSPTSYAASSKQQQTSMLAPPQHLDLINATSSSVTNSNATAAASPVATVNMLYARQRSKSMAAPGPIFHGHGSKSQRHAANVILSGLIGTTTGNRSPVLKSFVSPTTQNQKNIYALNAGSGGGVSSSNLHTERSKYIKRPLIAKYAATSYSPMQSGSSNKSYDTHKQLAEMLGIQKTKNVSIATTIAAVQQQLPLPVLLPVLSQQQQQPPIELHDNRADDNSDEQQNKTTPRINKFYERRRKLKHKSAQQQQQKSQADNTHAGSNGNNSNSNNSEFLRILN